MDDILEINLDGKISFFKFNSIGIGILVLNRNDKLNDCLYLRIKEYHETNFTSLPNKRGTIILEKDGLRVSANLNGYYGPEKAGLNKERIEQDKQKINNTLHTIGSIDLDYRWYELSKEYDIYLLADIKKIPK